MLTAKQLRILFYKGWTHLLNARMQDFLPILSAYFHQLRRRKGHTHPRDSFDALWGVDTSDTIPLHKLRIESHNAIHGSSYQATPPDLFYEVMATIEIAYEEFIFVDLGSGKGRVLLLASQCPFKKVIGIEFSRELTEIAHANLERCRYLSHSHIQLLCMDASDYMFPAEKSVIYLYNPFDGRVMASIVDNLRQSLLQHPRELYLVYRNPLHASVIDRSNLFKRVISINNVVIYAYCLQQMHNR